MTRNYKQEYKTQEQRGEHENRMERQRARRKLDAKGVTRQGKTWLTSRHLAKVDQTQMASDLNPPARTVRLNASRRAQ